jgi:hypothetical protein
VSEVRPVDRDDVACGRCHSIGKRVRATKTVVGAGGLRVDCCDACAPIVAEILED